jgi:acetyl/propionyl-CoA carboxylase alpha subunit
MQLNASYVVNAVIAVVVMCCVVQAIALNGRDCSIQRRHQKIIEEGPPVVAPPNIWREMEQAAISLAKEVGYSNAGTVEYLYTEEDNKVLCMLCYAFMFI